MSNWPNIQEYRNLEAKFVDDPNRNVIINSEANSDLETVIKDEYTAKNNADDSTNNHKLQNSESKIVRCVIKKDFEESFKKTEREDGPSCNQELSRPKPQEQAVVDRPLEKIRLQNHLKWKKQKEEEYLQKKEAERLAQQKKKEEEERLEKVRKEKEKERIEKLKEWQEQKAREKEEKKKEKMVIKLLEEELKVTPTVDKEKLIGEWVKLKNKQKQIEAEKKAELLRKEEESKAVRQTLAELSYQQWKERIKGRMMTLPKNGYQIFGPKPTAVVKEDWNHDFTRNSPRDPNYTLRKTDSSTTTLNFSPAIKELEDLSKEIFYLGNIKSRSSSFYQLKRTKSGLKLNGNSETSRKSRDEMPLKELQQGTIELKQKESNKGKNIFDKGAELTPEDFLSKFCLGSNHQGTDFLDLVSFPGAQGDHKGYFSPPKKKSLELRNRFPDGQILPNKKKIDLYINTCPDSVEENSEFSVPKKKTIVNTPVKVHKEVKKKKVEQKVSNRTTKIPSKETLSSKNRSKSLNLQKIIKNENENLISREKNPGEKTNVKAAMICRRSQSCEKSLKKFTNDESRTNNCSSSKSMVKVPGPGNEVRKTLTKSKTSSIQKRKIRKADTPEVSHSKSEKKLWEVDHKNKKKPKRKNSLSKSFSFIDSPYCTKSPSKTFNRVKTGRKGNPKDTETKSDEGGHRQKLSMRKI